MADPSNSLKSFCCRIAPIFRRLVRWARPHLALISDANFATDIELSRFDTLAMCKLLRLKFDRRHYGVSLFAISAPIADSVPIRHRCGRKGHSAERFRSGL